ncbi:Holliday junction DNA helicase RuvA [Thermoanaerobacterium thermosaccharolyticum]|uniref:Putative pre-16S rRNA nuclease n=2 Tax=Thermoanaerobacterium thermosaccharolyticum TaxID=1517 RepID=A0A231VHP4_THETR|nr:Holliday junction resolvase RuvX [Thermoanaerobacterium thermosaccharolyticum]AGB18873.1 RNAse H-fold protein YqgF [Thermoanaerobacterium thermosaccharolyticum M0795]AST59182.1 holliday junction resolvase [Thermoanaerobacterium thermosaccharolyticum]MCP2239352.1 putative Holliday junction resolvase [Thermoanaerobacterium thermosaccharolyticum]OXT07679.1 Holliday junction resolvase RuvX [Thermoanaerobacterium thermosaccharolyticum]PHO06905.1 Holliday junction DNA helicase RuvA [Thermoanaerob
MRTIGLDVGDKTIGVAISDPSGLIAQGIKTIKRSNLDEDIQEINKIINSFKAEEIVVGFPKNMNGTIGPQGQKVINFVEILKKEIDLPILLWDERLTTVEANRMLIEGADMRRDKRKKVIDKLAATIILQGYLDHKRKLI